MSDCCSVNGSATKAPPVMDCPVSGTRSKRVDLLTVKSLVRTLPLGMQSTQFYFCESPACDVVYFPLNPAAPVFRRADLLVPVWNKEQAGSVPVCYCFGFTGKNILDEIEQSGRSTASERIRAEVQAGNCACEVKNPSGKCCLGNITQIVRNARVPASQR